MHAMQTTVTDIRGVCLSVCPSVCHALSFVAAFAKSLWLHVSASDTSGEMKRDRIRLGHFRCVILNYSYEADKLIGVHFTN